MRTNVDRRVALIALVLLTSPVFVFAQNGGAADGSVPTDPRPAESTAQAPATDATPTPADSTGGTAPVTPTPASNEPATTSTPTPTGSSNPTIPTTPTTPTNAGTQPSGSSGAPVPAPTLPPQPIALNLAEASTEAVGEPSGANPWLWPVLGFLALIPFGWFVAGYMKKKPPQTDDDSGNRCFDIKQMMEEKLKELTDVQGMVKEKAIEKGKEAVRDAVSGTATGDLLVRAQKLEEQYKKLKALYEECKIDIDAYAYKAVLIENSLHDKEILRHVRVLRSETVDNLLVHHIRLSKSQIEDIQKHIVDMKWFFHVWSPGKDDVMVVFKDRIFNVKHSDERTWAPAIAYGLEQGIPRGELSFRIE